jgi:Galactose oxidase, central domain
MLCRFGGGTSHNRYNDTWLFDVSTRKWTELQCTGCVPSSRRGHAAALVDDVMYVFGGRDVDGRDLGDLIAFKLSSKRFGKFNPRVRSHTTSSSGMVHVAKKGTKSKQKVGSCHGP